MIIETCTTFIWASKSSISYLNKVWHYVNNYCIRIANDDKIDSQLGEEFNGLQRHWYIIHELIELWSQIVSDYISKLNAAIIFEKSSQIENFYCNPPFSDNVLFIVMATIGERQSVRNLLLQDLFNLKLNQKPLS